MKQKSFKRTLYLFYILTLLFWSVISGTTSVSEITGSVCGAEEYYVNCSCATSSTLISLDNRLPVRENLSARDTEGPETLSAARNQRIKTLSRSVRHTAANFFSCDSSGNLYAVCGQFHRLNQAAHSLCGITITNYIHHQDGKKS